MQGKAKQPTIGKLLDDAMVAIEHDNQALKGVLAEGYARPAGKLDWDVAAARVHELLEGVARG